LTYIKNVFFLKKMKNTDEILAQSLLFSGLPPEQLKKIGAITVTKHVAKGAAIFFEGDPGIGFYMVATGKVKIFKTSFDGKEQILHIFGPGEPFGEVPVFHGNRFAAQIENLSLKEVPGRLASYLFYLMEEQNSQQRVTLDVPKGQLANLLGATSETLSRIFNKMSEEGLIRVEGKTIYILDAQRLRDR